MAAPSLEMSGAAPGRRRLVRRGVFIVVAFLRPSGPLLAAQVGAHSRGPPRGIWAAQLPVLRRRRSHFPNIPPALSFRPAQPCGGQPVGQRTDVGHTASASRARSRAWRHRSARQPSACPPPAPRRGSWVLSPTIHAGPPAPARPPRKGQAHARIGLAAMARIIAGNKV